MSLRRLLLIAVAGVLGVACGVITAVLIANSGPSADSTSSSDPLHLGGSLQNVGCTGESVLVVGWGDYEAPLASAMANNPTAHYLQTADSCDTKWRLVGKSQQYAVYLGPYDTLGAACAVRMTPEHKGEFVTRLVDGNTEFVQCGCYVASQDMPELGTGGEPDVLDSIWTRTLQQMLYDGKVLSDDDNSGLYDARTRAAVKRLQDMRALPPTGVTDPDTWHVLQQTACPSYTS